MYETPQSDVCIRESGPAEALLGREVAQGSAPHLSDDVVGLKRRNATSKIVERNCDLPSCGALFQARVQNAHRRVFCCHAHRKAYYRLARDKGCSLLEAESAGREIHVNQLPPHDRVKARTQADELFAYFEARPHRWIGDMYARFRHIPRFAARIFELRQRGHEFHHRCVVESDGSRSYEYCYLEPPKIITGSEL